MNATQLSSNPDQMLKVIAEAAYKALRNHRMSNMICGEGDPCDAYPLVDLVSTEGETIATGEHEIDLMVESIIDEVGAALGLRPAAGVEPVCTKDGGVCGIGGYCANCHLGTDSSVSLNAQAESYADVAYSYECAQPGTDGKGWSEIFSREKPPTGSHVRNVVEWRSRQSASSPLSASDWKSLAEYARVRDEFRMATQMGASFCVESALLTVDSLAAAVASTFVRQSR